MSICRRLAEQGEQSAHRVLSHFINQPVHHGQHPAMGGPVAVQALRQKPQLHLPPVLLGPLPGDDALALQGDQDGVHLGFQNPRVGAEVAGSEAAALLLGLGQQVADDGLVEGQAGHQPLVVNNAGQPQPDRQELLVEHGHTPPWHIVHNMNYMPKPSVCQEGKAHPVGMSLAGWAC